MKQDNRGLSLVEVVIVIAIIGVLAGVLIGSSGYISGSAAKGLANSIKTAIGETRIKTMGKQETVVFFYKDSSDGRYYKQYIYKKDATSSYASETAEMIGKNQPEVKYYDNAGNENTLDSTGLLIGFDRRSGKEIVVNNVDVNGTTRNSTICTKIVVSGGGNIYDIEIVPATGKIILK